MEWQPPRCIHGNIILGCPHDDCPAQNAYLDQANAAIREWEHRGRQAARDYVRSALGPRPAPNGMEGNIGMSELKATPFWSERRIDPNSRRYTCCGVEAFNSLDGALPHAWFCRGPQKIQPD